MTYWESQKFKAMQEAWYKRLESEGFQDAEELKNGQLILKQSAAHPYRWAKTEGERQCKEDYYRAIADCAQRSSFSSLTDRLIMTWHAEGKSQKAIRENLYWLGFKKWRNAIICRHTIRFTIRKYEMAWGIRQYTAKQLNKKVS